MKQDYLEILQKHFPKPNSTEIDDNMLLTFFDLRQQKISKREFFLKLSQWIANDYELNQEERQQASHYLEETAKLFYKRSKQEFVLRDDATQKLEALARQQGISRERYIEQIIEQQDNPVEAEGETTVKNAIPAPTAESESSEEIWEVIKQKAARQVESSKRITEAVSEGKYSEVRKLLLEGGRELEELGAMLNSLNSK